jgi:hypothetical protein
MSAASELRFAPSAGLRRLVAANAPLWAGEAAVFSAYWDAPTRTRASDLTWLARQCRKELFDGVLPRTRAVDTLVRSLGATADRDALTTLAEGIQTEIAHFRAFASVYDELRHAIDPRLDAARLDSAEWPENRALASLRARHRQQHGELGRRAESFTEGGYCTLYTAGRSLAGRSGIDDVIAAACAEVVDDEWDHMIAGIAGLEDQALSAADWDLLTALTVEQGRCRVRMRNAQFGDPLAPDALLAAETGALAPLDFDFERAGFAAP